MSSNFESRVFVDYFEGIDIIFNNIWFVYIDATFFPNTKQLSPRVPVMSTALLFWRKPRQKSSAVFEVAQGSQL